MAPLLLRRSLPARSIKFNIPCTCWSVFCEVVEINHQHMTKDMLQSNIEQYVLTSFTPEIRNVKTKWLRDDSSFMFVLLTDLEDRQPTLNKILCSTTKNIWDIIFKTGEKTARIKQHSKGCEVVTNKYYLESMYMLAVMLITVQSMYVCYLLKWAQVSHILWLNDPHTNLKAKNQLLGGESLRCKNGLAAFTLIKV